MKAVFKKLVIGVSLAAIVAGAVLLIAYKILNSTIKHPDFKSRLEHRISAATGGDAHIGAVDGHVSWHPWIAFHDFSLSLATDTIRVQGAEMRFDPKLLPLFKGKIIGNLSLHDGRLAIFELKTSSAPILELKTDATVLFPAMRSIYPFHLKGYFSTKKLSGALDATGQLILKEVGSPAWNTDVRVSELTLHPSGTPLPVEIDGEALSIGGINITAKWRSLGTNAVARFMATHWDQKTYECHVDASYLDLAEIASTFSDLKPLSSPKKDSISSSTWSVQTSLDLKNIAVPRGFIPRFQAHATMRADGGELSDLSAELLGGEVTGVGSWKNGAAGVTPRVSLRAHGQKMQVEKLLALTISSVSWTGAFNFDCALADFPIPNIGRLDAAEILKSLSKSRGVDVKVTADASSIEKSPLKSLLGTLTMNPAEHFLSAGLKVGWKNGGLTARASLPRRPAGPVDASMKIDNLDLAFLPELAKRLSISVADVGADLEWHADSIGPSMLDRFSPTVTWSVNGSLKQFVWRGIPFDKVTGRVAWNRSEIELEKIQGLVSSGTFTADGNLSNRTAEGFKRFSVNAKLSNIEIEPFMFALSTDPVLLKGRFASTMNLTGDFHPWNPESLSGTASVSGVNGRFREGSFTMGMVNRLNIRSVVESATGQKQKGLPFTLFTATGAVKNGIINFELPLVLKTPHLDVAYTGWLDTKFTAAKGMLVVNPLGSTRNLVNAIPGVSTLLIGSSGELLPLIVELDFHDGNLKTQFQSVKTLASTPLRIINNVIHLPANLLKGSKK